MATHFVHIGKKWCITKLDDSQVSVMNRIGWGSGTGTTEADTALGAEHTETRAVGTISRETTAQPEDTYQVVGTLTANADKNVSEGALFDAATGGNMLLKGDFPTIPLLTGDSIEFTCSLQAVQPV